MIFLLPINLQYFLMMITDSKILKGCFCAAFFIIFNMIFEIGAYGADPVEKPDFAFPATVEANARVALQQSLARHDEPGALKAALEITLARNLVSADSVSASIKMFDDLATSLDKPYRGLADLLNASLYADIYIRNSWKIDRRTLPPVPVPENIMEWSREMFETRVDSLVSVALNNAEGAEKILVKDLNGLISIPEEGMPESLSLYDFMIIKGAELLYTFDPNNKENIIPFGYRALSANAAAANNPSLSLLNKDIERNQALQNTEICAYLDYLSLNYVNSDKRNSNISELVTRYIDTPYCAPFLLKYNYAQSVADDDENESGRLNRENKGNKAIYTLVSNYLERFPDCFGAEALKAKSASLLLRKIDIKIDEDVLPGRDFNCRIDLANIFDLNVLVIKLPDSYAGETISMANIRKFGKVIKVVPFKFSGAAPEKYIGEIKIPALESGVYIALPSSDTTLNGIYKNTNSGEKFSTFTVTRLALFEAGVRTDGVVRLYVVDAFTQKPESAAKVTAVESRDRSKKIIRTTDSNGCVELPSGGYSVKVTKGNDIVCERFWSKGGYAIKKKRTYRARILTDLAIYHPGDSLNFVGMVFSELDRRFRSEKDMAVNAVLYNANYEPVDTLNLVSDGFGRVAGRFQIPQSGLLGYYNVEVKGEKQVLGSASVEVSEYKSPTFYVTVEGSEDDYKLGDVVKLSGEARTYSGMPVAFSKVKYSVSHVPLWWRSYSQNGVYGGEVTTDESGKFLIELPTEGLRNTPFANGNFRITASVTSPMGETQESVPLTFSLGHVYQIDAQLPSIIEVGSEESRIDVRVFDISHRSVKRTVYYQVERFEGPDTTSIFTSGQFEAPLSKFDFSSYPSGKYRFIFSFNKYFEEEEGVEPIAVNTVLYRSADKRPPIETPLWLPATTVNFKKGSPKAEIKLGSSYKDSWIFMLKADCDKELERKWIKVDGNILKIDVPAPESNQRIFITFSGMHDGERVTKNVTLIPFEQTQKINITAESFRDKIMPGGKESWKFRFMLDDKTLPSLPVSAVMSNKALDAIIPFEWTFNPYGEIYYPRLSFFGGSYSSKASYNVILDKSSYHQFSGFKVPFWNLYGMPLYSNYGNGMLSNKMSVRGTNQKFYSAKASSATAGMAMVEEQGFDSDAMALEETVVVTDMTASKAEDIEEAESGSAPASEKIADSDNLRDVECPIAFFMPSLVTDESGTVNVDFKVPQFNGTWKFQIMGYTPEMLGGVLVKEAVASKPVMAQMNAPRFVRTGDRLSISGMLYNNSAETLAIGGRLEIFNPIDGKVIEQQEFTAEDVKVASGRPVSMEFVIGDVTDFLGIRLYATTSGFSDGEQTVIPVYPSSTPVIESETFYLAPGTQDYEMQLPDSSKGRLTLQYCDNPIWECVTALPELDMSSSASVLSKISALFGNAIGAGLVREHPEIAEAIRLFSDPANAEDSTLVSNLERNASLKAVLLGNTPWVLSAKSETLRMQNLIKFTDIDKCRKVIEAGVDELGKLQNADGGWSWCGGRESSRFITSRVLSGMAMLEGMGYLPQSARPIAVKALKYCDTSWVRELHQYKGKAFPYISMADYLYIRSFFKGISSDSEFGIMHNKAVSALKEGWKKLDIYEKATAATLLFREGYKMEARTILESLRQFATVTKTKGMWFDKLSSSFMGKTKLLTTAKVLEAFSEIAPGSDDVNKLRQWLLITRQAENWGDDRSMAEAINAILTSGSKWTDSASRARIYIDGKVVETDKAAALTGSFTYSGENLNGGKLKIERDSSSPAWGGIVSQFIAPIADVRSEGDSQLSIEKNIYAVAATEGGAKATSGKFKMGDRVRVTLTIRCDRDLEYVSVVDSRAACLEPVDQISEYAGSDGVWYYREVRDNATNLFITWLPKGTHVVSYECFIDREGQYASGIATIQSQYAPTISAHSEGSIIKVE